MNRVFLFGKLPAHGDFVCRGMTEGERTSLDGWLSGEMATAIALAGTDFEAAFDSAPPWRFVWQEQSGWAAGALAASTDSVGRRFPILLGRRMQGAGAADMGAAHCEEAIYAAIVGTWTADRLVEEAAAFEPVEGDGPGPAERWWVDGGEDAAISPLEGRQPSGLIRAMVQAAGAAA